MLLLMKRPWPVAATLFTILCFNLIWMGSYRARLACRPSPESSAYGLHDSTHDLIVNHSGNSTLGFQRIFFVSLPHRLDRHDAISLISSMTGISPTLEPGVNGSLLHTKAKPEGSGSLRPEQLGCWRAHANVWKRILDEDIETALVIEDDVDWDIHIRDIFTELSHQLAQQTLFSSLSPRSHPILAPYGLDWDLLYVGSAWDIPNEDRPPYLLYHDPYAPTRNQTGGAYIGELEGWGVNVTSTSRHRLIAPSWYPVSTMGYAITKKGAQKLLYNLGGYKGLGSPVDLAMIYLIQQGIVDSYTIIPPIITRYSTGEARDSDINEVKPEESKTEPGSENLSMGARKALEQLSENHHT